MSLFLPAWVFLCPLDPWHIDLPVAVSDIGTLMLIAGAGLALAALYFLRGVENIDHLVTGGLFKYLRHPMYAGFILWIVGWIVRQRRGDEPDRRAAGDWQCSVVAQSGRGEAGRGVRGGI